MCMGIYMEGDQNATIYHWGLKERICISRTKKTRKKAFGQSAASKTDTAYCSNVQRRVVSYVLNNEHTVLL